MENLKIITANGEMNIYVDTFFPCDQQRLKKLLKIMRQNWNNPVDEQIELLKVNFQKRIEEAKESMSEAGKKYLDAMQKKAELDHIIESKKHPNGVRCTKDELKVLVEQRKHENASVAAYLHRHKKNDQLMKALQRNLDTINNQENR